MVKRFSTVRDHQRGSQSYMKNRRGRKEIEVIRRRERGTQEERDRSTQLSAQTPTKIHRLDWEERGKEEIESVHSCAWGDLTQSVSRAMDGAGGPLWGPLRLWRMAVLWSPLSLLKQHSCSRELSGLRFPSPVF